MNICWMDQNKHSSVLFGTGKQTNKKFHKLEIDVVELLYVDLSWSEGITGIFYNSYQSEFRSFNKVGHFSKRWKMGIFTKQTNERRTFLLSWLSILLFHFWCGLTKRFEEEVKGRIKDSVKVFVKPPSYLRFLPVPSLFLLSMRCPLQVPLSPEYTTNANHHHFEDHHIHDHDADHPLML